MLVLASSTPDTRPMDGGDGPGGAWLGVSEYVTFHLLDIFTGKVMDRTTLRADSVHLTQQGAVSLYDDVMSIVAPGQQTVYLIKILSTGKFEMLRTLGWQCNEDDEAVAAAQEEQEKVWNLRNVGAGGGSGAIGSSGRGGGGDSQHVAATTTAGTSTAAATPVVVPRQQHQQHDINRDGEHPPPPPPVFIEGLKQRLLAHLFVNASERNKTYLLGDGEEEEEEDGKAPSSANTTRNSAAAAAAGFIENSRTSTKPPPPLPVKNSSTSGPFSPLSQFIFHFRHYVEMEILAAVLVDSTRLLISWKPPLHPRAGHAALYARSLHMLYNMTTTAVEKVFEGNNIEFSDWCLENGAASLGGTPCNDWDRCLIPGLWGEQLRRKAAQDPFSRLMTGGVLPGCQQQQASPYLDPEIFQFDEKSVTRDLVPRPPLHRPVKFVARKWPERLRFKFEAEDVMGEAGGAGTGPRDENTTEVVFIFHPTMPFVMAVVESTETGLAEELSFFAHCS